jgi:hypothetical protein
MDTDDLINTRVEYVRLTNNLPFAFTDRYDGVPFTVAPGKSENFPTEVAAHFFGYDPNPAAQMRHVAKRQGWNTPDFVKLNEESGKNKAQEYFDKLKIEQVVYKLVPVEDGLDPREPIPADPEVPQEAASNLKPGRGSAKQKTA